MGEHGGAGGRGQPRIEAGIGVGDDVRDFPLPLAEQPQDLLLALKAVADEVTHILLRIGHGLAVRRIIDAILPLPQLL